MSKFKVGDEVVLVKILKGEEWFKRHGGKIGGIYSITDFWDNDIGIQGLDGSGQKFYVSDYNIELHKALNFKTSNRYKLHKYILNTGFSKLDLSQSLNKGDSFLSVETRESQFTNRGDMSDARYKSLRKQIKEVVQIKSTPVDISVIASEINQTLLEVEPKEKFNVADIKITIDGKEVVPMPFHKTNYDVDEKVEEAKQALETFHCKPKSSNNGVSILALVFFVMLVIFILGCLIYKAS